MTFQRSWIERTDEHEQQQDEHLDIDVHAEDEKIYVASYLQLMWWRFLKHRLAVIASALIIILYLIAAFAEFVAPYDPEQSFVKYKFAPPTNIHIIDTEGRLQRPFVYKIIRERDPETLRNIYTEDTTTVYPIRFVVRSTEYELWGRFPTSCISMGWTFPTMSRGSFSWARTGSGVTFSPACLMVPASP